MYIFSKLFYTHNQHLHRNREILVNSAKGFRRKRAERAKNLNLHASNGGYIPPQPQTTTSIFNPFNFRSCSEFHPVSHLCQKEMDLKLMTELEAMGFSTAQATKALCSGNSSIEAAINWIIDHENDTTSSEMPMVPANIPIEAVDLSHISEQVKLRAHALRKQAHQKKADEERKLEREGEKERIRAGKELLEAKRLAEEMDQKRFLAQRKLEKEEERRARERIRQKLQQDKLERRSMLGLPSEGSMSMNPATALPQNLSIGDPALLPVKPTAEREIMRECLRYLKHRNKEDNAKAIMAFHTLLIYVRNVVINPDEGKFRKIRISNPVFQDRVGKFEEGIKFLQLCGFETVEGDNFLFLAREKVHMDRLKIAGNELQNALTNPFFGLLST